MNIEEIKNDIAQSVEKLGDEIVMWSAEVNEDCVIDAYKIARVQWPQAKLKTFRDGNKLRIHATIKPPRTIRHEGTHLRVSTIEVNDPEQAMSDAGIEYVAMVGQPIGDQVWFMDCTNVPDQLPDWSEVFQMSKETLDAYFLHDSKNVNDFSK